MAFYHAIREVRIQAKPALFPAWWLNKATHYEIHDNARASRVEATMFEFAPLVKKATKQYKVRVIGGP